MQRLTTQEPTDDIIEVGIESIKAVLYGIPEKPEATGDEETKESETEEKVESEEQEN